MTFKVALPDLVSNSYFPAIAAVELGHFKEENIDAEIALNPYLNRLIIAKDYLGAAYLPEWNFNGIGTLERGFGYQIKISESIIEFNLCNP